VPLREAYENLLIPLRTPRASDSTPFTGLRLQIERYLSDNANATCTVYRMSGGIVRDRGVKDNGELRNLFQGAYPDTKGEIYPGDSKIRVKDELTIQIHTLRVINREARQVIAQDVPAIAVFVPVEMTAGWLVQEEEGAE
jgi:hypothetical protein